MIKSGIETEVVGYYVNDKFTYSNADEYQTPIYIKANTCD